MDNQPLILLANAAVLGFRHGIDWDHIAAISDIVGASTTEDRSDGATYRGPIHLSSMYAFGHAAVVTALGLLALCFATVLPAWIDPLMERLVGWTLLVLGVFVCITLVRFVRGEEKFRPQSRWMLALTIINRAWEKIWSLLTGRTLKKKMEFRKYGDKTAFGVGMVHGIGAETGTQVLLIAALGGAAKHGLGPAMLVAFVLGLLASNTLLAVIGTTGYVSSKRNQYVYVAAAALTCCFSLLIGSYFALGRGQQLPDLNRIFGGAQVIYIHFPGTPRTIFLPSNLIPHPVTFNTGQ